MRSFLSVHAMFNELYIVGRLSLKDTEACSHMKLLIFKCSANVLKHWIQKLLSSWNDLIKK